MDDSYVIQVPVEQVYPILTRFTIFSDEMSSMQWGFNGSIYYDAQGNQIPRSDVEVFTSGQQNPFDIMFHSSGFLYGTDNGPNR